MIKLLKGIRIHFNVSLGFGVSGTIDQRPHGYFKGRPQPAVEQDTSYFVLFFGVSGIGKIWMWEKSIVKTYKK